MWPGNYPGQWQPLADRGSEARLGGNHLGVAGSGLRPMLGIQLEPSLAGMTIRPPWGPLQPWARIGLDRPPPGYPCLSTRPPPCSP